MAQGCRCGDGEVASIGGGPAALLWVGDGVTPAMTRRGQSASGRRPSPMATLLTDERRHAPGASLAALWPDLGSWRSDLITSGLRRACGGAGGCIEAALPSAVPRTDPAPLRQIRMFGATRRLVGRTEALLLEAAAGLLHLGKSVRSTERSWQGGPWRCSAEARWRGALAELEARRGTHGVSGVACDPLLLSLGLVRPAPSFGGSARFYVGLSSAWRGGRQDNGKVFWRPEGDAGNQTEAELSSAPAGGCFRLATGFFPDFRPLAATPLPTKDGHVGWASVGERGSILLSHPLPIQPNCVDGSGARRLSNFLLLASGRRGAGAVATR
uniref:Uncharacterized protein n=1 Tax=Leersia perrieri TaxID=77586 RepID=A0A0D9VHH6_9ORYZ